MMGHVGSSDEFDEFDEFDVTEAQFDQMIASAEPVTVETLPSYHRARVTAEGYYTLTTVEQSSAAVVWSVGGYAPRRQVSQTSAVPSAT